MKGARIVSWGEQHFRLSKQRVPSRIEIVRAHHFAPRLDFK